MDRNLRLPAFGRDGEIGVALGKGVGQHRLKLLELRWPCRDLLVGLGEGNAPQPIRLGRIHAQALRRTDDDEPWANSTSAAVARGKGTAIVDALPVGDRRFGSLS